MYSAVRASVLAFALVLAVPSAWAQQQPSHDQLVKLVQTIDERQRSPGDYRVFAYIEAKEKGKTDTAQEAIVYRRNADRKLMILFTKPKSQAGKGYLRLDKNLWFYDPTVGRWERRTDRERINGTDSRREDFDESHLAEDYDVSFAGEGKLGKYDVWILDLNVKPGHDVAYPIVKLWVDKSNNTMLKRQDFALSKRLMRTEYYPRWDKLYSESKKAEVWFPGEIRIYDEIEKANSTLVVLKDPDLRPLEQNIFTKAWLEAKSR
jgi:outer membrane lipoprotein-sorting protein